MNFDPTKLHESMQHLMTAMLLPLSFFMVSRKILNQVVSEKEKGIIAYLQLNGMSQTAYNISFILYEIFVDGIIISICLDLLLKYYFVAGNFVVKDIICFNLGLMFFLGGLAAFTLMISKAFNGAGFATQIGSIFYLLPIFTSLYLKVLQMKHSFSKKALDEKIKIENEEEKLNLKYSKFNVTIQDVISTSKNKKFIDSYDKKNLQKQMRVEDKTDKMNYTTRLEFLNDQKFLQIRNKTNQIELQNLQLFDTGIPIWEKIAQKSLIFFPHTPFSDISISSFDPASNSQELIQSYCYQVFDIVIFISIVYFIENFKRQMKYFIRLLKGEKNCKKEEKIKYSKLPVQQEETELQDSFISGNQNIEQISINKITQRRKNQNSPPNETNFKEKNIQKETIPAVMFQNMTKKFGSFKAVDCLNIELFKNQIFCFLGHNGAGKTTALNVLMGKEKPSTGTILLNLKGKFQKDNIDITENTQQAQSQMGVCSQHDILFDTLTVEQHMYLFYQLKADFFVNYKNGAFKSIEQRVDELIKTVSLQTHRNVESQNLSGGLKRRLSIALALVSPNDSSIVILDEPTTGLDAMVRDQVWQLIKSLKNNRCIIMTTQHLQEAEELADQVGLLSLGKLISKGSVDEIKKKFGIGYNLIIDLQDGDQAIRIEDKILTQIEGSYKDHMNQNPNKLQYILPFKSVHQFQDLFLFLENCETKYILKQTSLEDAFLNFTNIQNSQKQENIDQNLDQESLQKKETILKLNSLDKNIENISNFSTFMLQFQATFLKRWYSFKRDWRMWLIMIIPSLIISSFLALGFQREYSPTAQMTLSEQLLGGKNQSILNIGENDLSKLISNLGTLSNHGQSWQQNSSDIKNLGERYFQTIKENPSVENVLKSFIDFQNSDLEDPELQELQLIIKDTIKEDLGINSTWDMLAFGMKIMTQSQSGNNEEINAIKDKLQLRLQNYFEQKMAPVMAQIVKEQMEILMVEGIRYMKEIIYLIWIIFSLAQCSGIAVENPVLERETKIRYYLNVLGIGQGAYWAGNFCFDILCFAFQATIMITLIYPLKLTGFQKNVDQLIKLMTIFGFAHTLFSYLISFAFKKPSNALKFISIVYMLAGFVVPFIFKMISMGLDRCQGYFYPLSQFLSQMIPLQPMSQGLIYIINEGHIGWFDEQNIQKNKEMERIFAKSQNNGQTADMNVQLFKSYEECDGYVKDYDSAILAMCFSCVLSTFLIIIIERMKLFFYQRSENYYQESQTISSDKNKFLQIRNLKKTYQGKVLAVKEVSFDLNSKNEILGLLGGNGAGKSSTFNMITMQIQRTSGDIHIFNKDIKNTTVLQNVNITSQSDILWPYLSIQEHFKIIAMITGKPNYQNRLIELSKQLELDKSYKRAGILSGGNKRKLCTALTLLTSPKLAYFDEPTVGLDPVSRRNLLNLIKLNKASVLFTTHRLDEAEFLCNRVAIMQQGKILFDGKIEDLMRQHQEDDNNIFYYGIIIVKKPLLNLENLLVYTKLDQEDIDQAIYKIVKKVEMSQIFRDFSQLKLQEQIQDFSYFEPSLHHAFVALNKSQEQYQNNAYE